MRATPTPTPTPVPAAARSPSLVGFSAVSASIGYSIQTLRQPDRADEYRLWVEHRHSRGLIQAPEIDEIRGPTPDTSGVVVRFVAEDGLLEQLGTVAHPLPRELFDAAQSEAGLVIIFLDSQQKRIVNGQVLWVEPLDAPQRVARPCG